MSFYIPPLAAVEHWISEQFKKLGDAHVMATEYKTETDRDVITTYNIEKLLNRRQQQISEEELNRYYKIISEVAKKGIVIEDECVLEEVVDCMIELSFHRAKLSKLYTEQGLKYMRALRESFITYYTIMSDLRRQRKEYVPFHFLDKPVLSEISEVLLGIPIDEKLPGYKFTVLELLRMLQLEMACADSASGLEVPLLRMKKKDEEEDSFYMIPTPSAFQEYSYLTERIQKKRLTMKDFITQLQTKIQEAAPKSE